MATEELTPGSAIKTNIINMISVILSPVQVFVKAWEKDGLQQQVKESQNKLQYDS